MPLHEKEVSRRTDPMLRGPDPSSVFSSSLSVSKISVASDIGRGAKDRLPKNERVWDFSTICTACGRNSCSHEAIVCEVSGDFDNFAQLRCKV